MARRPEITVDEHAEFATNKLKITVRDVGSFIVPRRAFYRFLDMMRDAGCKFSEPIDADPIDARVPPGTLVGRTDEYGDKSIEEYDPVAFAAVCRRRLESAVAEKPAVEHVDEPRLSSVDLERHLRMGRMTIDEFRREHGRDPSDAADDRPYLDRLARRGLQPDVPAVPAKWIPGPETGTGADSCVAEESHAG